MGDDPGHSASGVTRRTFLAACAPLAASCARGRSAPAGPEPVSMPLERFPSGVRVQVSLEGHPVEVLRTPSGVTARSLLCTHQGCEVAWSEAAQAYLCPCHEGKYDAEGRPKEGPPPAPLRSVPERLEGAVLLLGPG